MIILNRTNGDVSGMLYSNETTGVAYTAVVMPIRFIISDTQKEISGKSQLNGSCRFANLVMMLGIVERKSKVIYCE